jgi:hypothetical protein
MSTASRISIANSFLRRSWSRCHEALFPDPTLPPKQWETNVAGYLWEMGYTPECIRLVLDHATLLGSVECSAELAFSGIDRQHVESLLPERPAGEWARYPGTRTA